MAADNEIRGMLGEMVHTAFRKGCDGGGSHEVWMAIKQMEPEQWTNALEWMLWALDYSGYQIVKKSGEGNHD